MHWRLKSQLIHGWWYNDGCSGTREWDKRSVGYGVRSIQHAAQTPRLSKHATRKKAATVLQWLLCCRRCSCKSACGQTPGKLTVRAADCRLRGGFGEWQRAKLSLVPHDLGLERCRLDRLDGILQHNAKATGRGRRSNPHSMALELQHRRASSTGPQSSSASSVYTKSASRERASRLVPTHFASPWPGADVTCSSGQVYERLDSER
jgi:hypothetical protein